MLALVAVVQLHVVLALVAVVQLHVVLALVAVVQLHVVLALVAVGRRFLCFILHILWRIRRIHYAISVVVDKDVVVDKGEEGHLFRRAFESIKA